MKMMFRDAILLTNEYLSRSSHLDRGQATLTIQQRSYLNLLAVSPEAF